MIDLISLKNGDSVLIAGLLKLKNAEGLNGVIVFVYGKFSSFPGNDRIISC